MQGPTEEEVGASRRKLALEQAAAAQLAAQHPVAHDQPGVHKYRGQDPGRSPLADAMQAWARAAPTLPAGALLSVAQAGIGPDSPVGNYLLQNAVPALLYKPINEAAAAQANMPGGSQYAAQQLVSDPARLEALKNLPLDQMTNVVSHPVSTIANLDPGQIQQLGAGFGLPDKGPAVLREIGAVAQSGAEAIGMGLKQQAARTAQSVSNITHGDLSPQGVGPEGAQDYVTPKIHLPGLADVPGIGQLPGISQSPLTQGNEVGGTPIHFGTTAELTDPSQITLVNQLRGESLGTGLLPGGPAVAHAQAAQRAAASVAGSAMTPGRALAAFVTTPDSLAYKAVSGVTDAYVALHFDPALLVTQELTNAIKTGRTIGTVTNDAVDTIANHLVDNAQSGAAMKALRDYAGAHAAFDWSPYVEGDSLNAAGRALLGNDEAKIAQFHDLMDQAIEHRLTGTITRADENSNAPDAVLRNLERETSGGLSAESHDAIYNQAIEQMHSMLQAAGAPTAPSDLVEALTAKIRSDPVSIRSLYEHPDLNVTAESLGKAIVGNEAGLMSGFSQSVHPDRFDAFLLGPKGDKWAQQMADRGFTEIGRGTKWSLDAKLQLALAEANTPDEARAALTDHLSTLQGLPPTIGFHPVSNMRWASIIPTEFADINDANHMLERARQDLQLLKVPHAEWDKYLPDVVKSEGDYEKAYQAFTAIGNRGAQEITRRIPGYKALTAEAESLKSQIAAWRSGPGPELDALTEKLDQVTGHIRSHDSLARDLTNYFYQKGNESRLWHNDEIHGGANMVSGLAPTPEGTTAIEGPFGVSELLNRSIPTMGGGGQDASRAIQRAVGTWAPLFNSPLIGALPRASRQLLVDTIADNLTNYMKSFAMMHVGTGIRIIGSQGAARAARPHRRERERRRDRRTVAVRHRPLPEPSRREHRPCHRLETGTRRHHERHQPRLDLVRHGDP
jgi:hypothetical protein